MINEYKKVAIVSYNMYGNFTNYGSALQTYAIHKVINSIDPNRISSIVLDYCPDILKDKNVLNPFGNMWDKDDEAKERCRLSLPAIKINYEKFQKFYQNQYKLSTIKYTSANFNDSLELEGLYGYVCGSDTIFAVPEFGFDDGYYANFKVMRSRSVAYAASFGDFEISETILPELKLKLGNFNAIALREYDKIPLIQSLYNKPLFKVIDPTLLLKPSEYSDIIIEPEEKEPYLLLYSRRDNPDMQEFAESISREKGLKLIEISLNAKNANRHSMRYDAGVEEFLGLVKNAEIVVTNSFHGMIFAVQFRRPFYIFSRKLCDTKISELLKSIGFSNCFFGENYSSNISDINYDMAHQLITNARESSLSILKEMLVSKI